MLADRVAADLEQPIQQYRESQRKARAAFEADLDKISKLLAKEQVNVEKVRKEYFAKGAAMTQAIQIAGKGQTDNMTKKDYEKIQEKAVKTKKEMDVAEAEYKAAVRKLDQVQDQWDEKMAEISREVQRLEEERLNILKTSFTKVFDAQLDLQGRIKQACIQKMKDSLELFNFEADMNIYLAQHATGSSKPARVVFQNYFSVAQNNAGQKRTFSFVRSSNSLSGSSVDLSSDIPHSRSGSSEGLNNNGQKSPLSRSKSHLERIAALVKTADEAPKVPVVPKSPLSVSSFPDLADKKSEKQASKESIERKQEKGSVAELRVESGAQETISSENPSNDKSEMAAESDEAKPDAGRKLTVYTNSERPSISESSYKTDAKVQSSTAVNNSDSIAITSENTQSVEIEHIKQNFASPDSGLGSMPTTPAVAGKPLASSNSTPSASIEKLADEIASVELKSQDNLANVAKSQEKLYSGNADHVQPAETVTTKSQYNLAGVAKSHDKLSAGNSEVVQPAESVTTKSQDNLASVAKSHEELSSGNTYVVQPAETVTTKSQDNLASVAKSHDKLSTGNSEVVSPAENGTLNEEPRHAVGVITSTSSTAPKPRVFSRRSIKMEGWVQICEENAQDWKKRWCSLEGGYLWFFDDAADNSKPQGTSKPKSMFSVSKCTVRKGIHASFSVPTSGDSKLAFTVSANGKREYVLVASDEDDLNCWVDALEQVNKKK